MSVMFNPFDESFQKDPYKVYRQLRDQDPVHRSTHIIEGWPEQRVISRYNDVMAVFRNKSLSRDIYEAEALGVTTGYDRGSILWDVMKHWATVRDGAEHSRLRKQVNRPFSSKLVDGLRDRIQDVAVDVLSRVDITSQFDLLSEFASPFAGAVIAEVVGLPVDEFARFHGMLADISDVADVDQRPHVIEQGAEAVRTLATYLQDVLSSDSPRGLIAEMMGDETVQDHVEVASAIAFLLTAGHENVVNMICNSVVGLLRFPDQLELLRSNPELVTEAVNELVRYESPVQAIVRYALDDAEIGGTTIQRGERLLCLLGSANRDGEQFSDPDVVDITRAEYKHVAFGFGLHSCIGVALAKKECEIALNLILREMPGIMLAVDEVEWKESASTRGPVSLPVKTGK